MGSILYQIKTLIPFPQDLFLSTSLLWKKEMH